MTLPASVREDEGGGLDARWSLGLDAGLRVRWTAGTRAASAVNPATGKPMETVGFRLGDARLARAARRVLEHEIPALRAFVGADGRPYLEAVFPAGAPGSPAEGVVVTWIRTAASPSCAPDGAAPASAWLEHAFDAVGIFTPRGRCSAANDALVRAFGLPRERLVGRTPRAAGVDASVCDAWEAAFAACARAQGAFERAVRFPGRDGPLAWDVRFVPLDRTGVDRAILVILRDATAFLEAGSSLERAIAESERRSDRHAACLATLADVARRVQGARRPESVLPAVLHRVARTWDWSFAHLLLRGADDVLVSGETFHDEGGDPCAGLRAASLRARVARGEGLAGRAFATGRAVYLAPLHGRANDARLLHARAAGLGAAVAVPFRARGRIRGVLELFGTERTEDEADLPALEVLAAMLAPALEHAPRPRALEGGEDMRPPFAIARGTG